MSRYLTAITYDEYVRRQRGHAQKARAGRAAPRDRSPRDHRAGRGAPDPVDLVPSTDGYPAWADDAEIGALLPLFPRLKARRPTGPAPEEGSEWGPTVSLTPNIVMRARAGHRAAYIRLRDGLYIVAEVPEIATSPSFGFLPLLVPLIVKAASASIKGIKAAVDKQHGKHDADQGLIEADSDDDVPATMIGCEGCNGRCGRS